MDVFLPVGVDKVSAKVSKRCTVGVIFAPQRLAESLGRSGTLTSLRVRVEDVAVRRVQTMKRRSRKFLVQTTGKWRVFTVENVLAPTVAVFGVPISWYSVPWSPFICRLKCESVEGWKTCAFPNPTAPSGTIGAWRGSVRLDKEGDDDRDRANLCICSVTVFMKSCC